MRNVRNSGIRDYFNRNWFVCFGGMEGVKKTDIINIISVGTLWLFGGALFLFVITMWLEIMGVKRKGGK